MRCKRQLIWYTSYINEMMAPTTSKTFFVHVFINFFDLFFGFKLENTDTLDNFFLFSLGSIQSPNNIKWIEFQWFCQLMGPTIYSFFACLRVKSHSLITTVKNKMRNRSHSGIKLLVTTISIILCTKSKVHLRESGPSINLFTAGLRGPGRTFYNFVYFVCISNINMIGPILPACYPQNKATFYFPFHVYYCQAEKKKRRAAHKKKKKSTKKST